MALANGVYRADGEAAVYVVKDGERYHIPAPEMIEQRFGGWGNVRVINPVDIRALPERPFSQYGQASTAPATTSATSGAANVARGMGVGWSFTIGNGAVMSPWLMGGFLLILGFAAYRATSR